MKKPNKDHSVWLILAGIFVYIAADSGILNFQAIASKLSFSRATSEQSEQLSQYAKKIDGGLTEAEKRVSAQKEKISLLQKTYEQIEHAIAEQRKSLQMLTAEIENYRKISGQQKPTESVPTKRSAARGPAGVITTPEQLQNLLSETTKVPTQVVKQKIKSKNYLSMKTDLRFSENNAAYLSLTGLRQAEAFARGALAMNMDKIVIAHTEDITTDEETNSRIWGISNYLKEVLNEEIEVKPLRVSNENIGADRNMELWAEGLNE